MKQKSNTEKLRFYRPRKRIGDCVKIAEMTGFTSAYVSRVLAGTNRMVPEIVQAAWKISFKRKTNREMGISLGKRRGRKPQKTVAS